MPNHYSGPKLDYIPSVTLGQFFFDSAKKFGARTCQIDAITGKHESFSTVSKRSTRVAIHMQKKGVLFEDVIMLCSSNLLDTAIPAIASLYLGAKIAPLDFTFSVRQITHLLSLVPPKMIFVEESFVGLIEQSLTSANLQAEIVVFGKSLKHQTFSDLVKPQPNEELFRPAIVDLNETAIILFSSGTTGLPKAVCHSNYNFLHLALCSYYTYGKPDVILSFSSFYWITTFIFLTCTFIGGGHRIVAGNTVEAEKTFQIIEKYKVTFLYLAPIATYELTGFQKLQNDISSVSIIGTSGTPLSPNQISKMGTIFQSAHILDCYGQTELGLISAFNVATDEELIRTKNGSCGKVAHGITLKIVDVQTNQVLGTNQKGEVRVKSDSIMTGYYKYDNSAVFDDGGFLRTGDIGYVDNDNCVFIVGRLKEIFKYACWHIVPSAIENVLNEHPAVKECVVFGIPKNEEVGELPAACVVLEKDVNVSHEEIEDFVAARVPDKEKLRGGVFFTEKIPKTSTGKVLRNKIQNFVLNQVLHNSVSQ